MDNPDPYEIVWTVSKAAALAVARKYRDMSSLREENLSIRNKSSEEMVYNEFSTFVFSNQADRLSENRIELTIISKINTNTFQRLLIIKTVKKIINPCQYKNIDVSSRNLVKWNRQVTRRSTFDYRPPFRRKLESVWRAGIKSWPIRARRRRPRLGRTMLEERRGER